MMMTHFELATHLQIGVQFDDWSQVAKHLDYAREHNIRVETRVGTRGAKATLFIAAMAASSTAHQSITGLPLEMAHEMARELVARGAHFVDDHDTGGRP